MEEEIVEAIMGDLIAANDRFFYDVEAYFLNKLSIAENYEVPFRGFQLDYVFEKENYFSVDSGIAYVKERFERKYPGLILAYEAYSINKAFLNSEDDEEQKEINLYIMRKPKFN